MTDPWAMSRDQKAYYLAQFLRLQPNPAGFLSGQSVKPFFELSKLPVADLSYIWELADVDADGQLSLSEFSVGMHLVVLRRNGIPLPASLPSSLRAEATPSVLSAPPAPSSTPPQQKPTTRHLGETKEPPAITDNMVTPSSPPRCHSNQSDVISLAEGMTFFDVRLAPDTRVPHPIAIRVQPPISAVFGGGRGPPRPPTPPPRAPHSKTISNNAQTNTSYSFVAAQKRQQSGDMHDGADVSQSEMQNNRIQQLTAMILPLQHECERVVLENNELTTELTRLQKRRIALEILLERLTPL